MNPRVLKPFHLVHKKYIQLIFGKDFYQRSEDSFDETEGRTYVDFLTEDPTLRPNPVRRMRGGRGLEGGCGEGAGGGRPVLSPVARLPPFHACTPPPNTPLHSTSSRSGAWPSQMCMGRLCAPLAARG